MTRQEIKDKLVEIMVVAMPEAEETLKASTEASNLHTDLGFNSVGMLFIVIAIEEFFSIRFENVNFGDFNTVSDVIDYIEKAQAQA